MLIGARDPIGIRPLVLGKLGASYVLASETCALDMVGAEFVREVENGEVVVITEDGIESHRPFPLRPARPCIFEYIYFARPDSVIGGRTVYDIRKQMGVQLAHEAPADVDVIVPIPDSGVPAAIGFAQESNVPFELGIIRNHYVGRTFIEPEQRIRALGVKLKHSANASVIRGKRIVLVDDSVVRGTTSKKIVAADVRGGRPRGAHAHRLPAHHASRLLRHRHAGQGRPAGRQQGSRGHARVPRRRQPRLPVGRRHLSRRRLRSAATRAARSSPTIASPANIRHRSPIRAGTRCRGSCRCWPRSVNASHRRRIYDLGRACLVRP